MNEHGKNITLDDLALMVGKGFKELAGDMDDGFKKVNERLDKVEGRLTVVEDQLTRVRSDIAELRYDYKKVVLRIENLEIKTFGSVQEA
jgi:hypothetical protein